ncbi:hypothetical protein ACH4ZU_09300 [Streptomyces sp. NPDC020472]|uniref:hypothetical protein n=1 Tax=Streptomyces sp. NPDC020472 TaxID=3365075 RepID=UPI00378D942D
MSAGSVAAGPEYWPLARFLWVVPSAWPKAAPFSAAGPPPVAVLLEFSSVRHPRISMLGIETFPT